MSIVKETEPKYETVDMLEMLSTRKRKWGLDIKELIAELKTCPEGKAKKRKFLNKKDQSSFATAVNNSFKQFSLEREYAVATPKLPEGHLFVVYIGRRVAE